MRQLVDQGLEPPALPKKQAVLVLPTPSSPFRVLTADGHRGNLDLRFFTPCLGDMR